jgi:hypothetical protein
MIIRDMFVRDIGREISGVVKVAQTDENKIYEELDEYVVTKEISKYLSKFYENYSKGINGNTDKMGVWISGFFGSGKSHFLKILSYLLDNENIKGEVLNVKLSLIETSFYLRTSIVLCELKKKS